jgi:hypothetical protein
VDSQKQIYYTQKYQQLLKLRKHSRLILNSENALPKAHTCEQQPLLNIRTTSTDPALEPPHPAHAKPHASQHPPAFHLAPPFDVAQAVADFLFPLKRPNILFISKIATATH